MTEAVTAASAINNYEIWEFLNRVSRPVGGGSDEDIWEGLGVPDEERVSWGEKFRGAADGVGRWLAGLRNIQISLSKREAGPAPAAKPRENVLTRMLGVKRDSTASAPAAPVEAQPGEKSGLFSWFGEIGRRFDEWQKQPVFGEREGAPAVAAPGAPEGEIDRFGWLKNGWKYLSGLPGGLFNKFRRQPETGAAPKISRAEGKKALRESAKQFVEQHGLTLVGGLLGIAGAAAGAAVVSPENIGMVNSYIREVSAVGVAGLSLAGLTIGEERGPENIPQAEKAYQRPIRALQRLCSQKAVRTGLFLTSSFATGFAAGGLGRMVVDTLQAVQQGAVGVPTEVSSPVDIAHAIGDTRREAIEAAQQGIQQAVQGGSTGGMTPEQLAAANAAGQEGASWAAQNAAHAADVVQQVAADAAAATGAARQAAETLANTPVAEIGRNLAGGGTVWGNEIAFAQQLGIDHVVPVANAMKNFAHVFTQPQPFTGIGPESSVNLLNRDVAKWLAGELNGIIGKDPNTLDSFHQMIWKIGYAGHQATSADLQTLAAEYASKMAP